jgi:hypothetical protein
MTTAGSLLHAMGDRVCPADITLIQVAISRLRQKVNNSAWASSASASTNGRKPTCAAKYPPGARHWRSWLLPKGCSQVSEKAKLTIHAAAPRNATGMCLGVPFLFQSLMAPPQPMMIGLRTRARGCVEEWRNGPLLAVRA